MREERPDRRRGRLPRLFVGLRERRRRRDTAAALLRISSAIDDYLYTNEHLPAGGRRSIFSGPNREQLMGGPVPAGRDVAREWERLIHEDDWDAHLAHRERLARGEPSEVTYRLRGYDGVTRWVHARTRSHLNGDRLLVDGIVSDITKRREAEEALLVAQRELERQVRINAHQALHDALTGLGNRRKLLADLAEALASADGRGVLVLCDLDGFKLYNDSFGHLAGDTLLARLGERLARAVEGRADAYRLGGDEFCVLARGSAAEVDPLVAAVAAALAEHGPGFSVTTSAGTCLLSEAADEGSILSTADRRLYEQKGRGRRSVPSQVAEALSAALRERNPGLGLHLDDVGELAASVAKRLGLPPAQVEVIRHAGQLHDVGKIAIPDGILNTPGTLSPEDRAFVRQHPLIGERIVATADALSEAAALIRSSHECYDGTGYPDGLAGDAIPLGARIVAVCDAYDALVGPRPYREGVGEEQALAELRRGAGTRFDPAVVDALAAALGDGAFTQAA